LRERRAGASVVCELLGREVAAAGAGGSRAAVIGMASTLCAHIVQDL
jgi:hypothetical protein